MTRFLPLFVSGVSWATLWMVLLSVPVQAQPGSRSATHGSSHPAATRLGPRELRIPAVRWFTDQPRQYVLVEPFKYVAPLSGEVIVVPAGFVTDFASIPGPLQRAFGPSIHDLPAVVHDYLYWRQSCSRTQADAIFYVALQRVGVSTLDRFWIRVGLMARGEAAYSENALARRQGLPRIIPATELEIPVTTWVKFRDDMRRRRVRLDAPDPKPPAYCRG